MTIIFKNEKPLVQEAIDRLPQLLESWFMFSLIWSVGATCDNDGRKKLSDWIRTQMDAEKLKLPFPKEGIVYDYLFDDGGIFSKVEEEKTDDEPIKYNEVRKC